MIVDIHSHAWRYPAHFSDDFRAQAQLARGGVEVDLTVENSAYLAAAPADESIVTIVFGGKARLSGLWVEDDHVAEYVSRHMERMLGFLSIDPTQPGWEEELRRGHRELGLVGIKLLPMYAGFFPHDERLDSLWQYASDHQLPVLLHAGTTFVRQAPLECTLPRHLDRVAIRFPEAKIVLAHLGHPFEGECIAVIRKHPNVLADVSALHYRPFQFFHSLMLVQEYGVWHKLLFGTDYPFTTVSATIETLRNLNDWAGATNRLRLNADAIEQLIHRDALKLLSPSHRWRERMKAPVVAVAGLGLLGRGIVACLVGHGFRVVGFDRSAASFDAAHDAIKAALQELVERQATTAALLDEWKSTYRLTANIDELSEATFVIESIVENLETKRGLFDQLEQIVSPETVIASNTSAIPISDLQANRIHPERFVGMHWAEPAHATRFLELIRGAATSDRAFGLAVELASSCGKEPSVVTRDVPEFIANRLGYAMYREALHLLQLGVADAETIDKSFRNSIGLWASFCGPLRWIDLTGGPILYARAMAPVLPTLATNGDVPQSLAELSACDAAGILNGRGFFEYKSDDSEKWEKRLREHAWRIKRLVDEERPLENWA